MCCYFNNLVSFRFPAENAQQFSFLFPFRAENEISFSATFSFSAENVKPIFGWSLIDIDILNNIWLITAFYCVMFLQMLMFLECCISRVTFCRPILMLRNYYVTYIYNWNWNWNWKIIIVTEIETEKKQLKLNNNWKKLVIQNFNWNWN